MYNWRLPFLPGSTSALMAVFLAGRTFGFIHFPVVIFSYYSFIILFIFSYFLFIIVAYWFCFQTFRFYFVYLLFLTSSEVFVGVSSSVGWLTMLDVVFCRQLWSNHPPFASSTCLLPVLKSPVPVSYFPCFQFVGFFIFFIFFYFFIFLFIFIFFLFFNLLRGCIWCPQLC